MTKTTKTAGTKVECQLCEGHFCSKQGLLVKHGYKRPGDGYLHGECGGTGHAPFPATDALVVYRDMIARMHSDTFAWLSSLHAGVVTHAVVKDEDAQWQAMRCPRSERAALLLKTRDLFVGVSAPDDLKKAFAAMTWAAEQKERWLRQDLARVTARLAKAEELNKKAA